MSELLVESRPDPLRGWVPVRFGRPGRRFEEIEVVLDWWPGEGHRYFRVRVHDGAEYILRHDLATGGWRVDVFRRDAIRPSAESSASPPGRARGLPAGREA